MLRRTVLPLVVCGLLTSCDLYPTAPISLTGVFHVHATAWAGDTPMFSTGLVFTLTQQGDAVNGTWGRGRDPVVLNAVPYTPADTATLGTITGTVNGDRIALWFVQSSPCTLLVRATGTGSDGGRTLVGTWSGLQCFQATPVTFTATRE